MHIVANEAFQRGIIVQGISSKLHTEFLEMWENDLNCAFESMDELLYNANGILTYFDSPLSALAVDWDDKNESFIWLFSKKVANKL